MEKQTEHRINLSWPFAGKFEASILNGVLDQIFISSPGKGEDDCGSFIDNKDYEWLKHLHTAIGDIVKEVETEQKRLGFSYPIDNVEPTPTEKP